MRWAQLLLTTAVGVLIFLASTAEATNDEEPEEGSKSMMEAEATPSLLNAAGLSKGVDAIIAEIRKREVELVLREQDVAERERAVAELETMIAEKVGELDQVRDEVEGRIAQWSSQGRGRVAQLSEVYSSMSAQQAGPLLSQLELDLAVDVIRGMKKKKSAGVLSSMRPARALEISRRMARPLDPTTDEAPASAK